MKLKKLVKLVLGSGLLAFSLTACGSNEEPKQNEPSAQVPEEKETKQNEPSAQVLEEKETKPIEDKSEGLENKEVEVQMSSHFSSSGTYKDTCKYNDYWFLEDSNNINYNLALLSAMAAGASYSEAKDNNGKKISLMLETAGYKNIAKNTYYSEGIKLEDSIGVCIGSKKIKDKAGEEYTILAIFPRSAGYGREFFGNMNTGKDGVHQGFKLARDEMLRFTKKYIQDNNIKGKLKIWTSGYSRGAATANLFGGFLKDDTGYFGKDVSIESKDVFVYTIGTPLTIPNNVSKKDVLSVSGPRGEGFNDTNIEAFTYNGEGTINPEAENYKGIFNLVATGDFIAKLPPKNWDFKRYGTSLSITYSGDKFVEYLSKQSQDVADKFKDKTYETKINGKTIDINTLSFKDTDQKQSADDLVNARLDSLLSLVNNRENYVNGDFDKVLGSLTSIYALDFGTFYDKVKTDKEGLIKTAILNYLAYSIELQNVADNEGVANVVSNIMSFLGKPVSDISNYTDQQLLMDLLDFLINDPMKDQVAFVRAQVISKLIPSPYGDLYINLLNYAKEKEIHPNCIDDLLNLLSSYITDNKTNQVVDNLMGVIAKAIPAQYFSTIQMLTGKTYDIANYNNDEAAMNKAVLIDTFELLAKGKYNNGTLETKPEAIRYVLLLFAQSKLSSKGLENTSNLLLNGASNGESTTVKDPNKLSVVIDELLKTILPKNELNETESIKYGANKALTDLLAKGKTDINSKYVEILMNEPDNLRKLLFKVIFDKQTSYSLKNDVDNALTFIEAFKFLSHAHDHELYISYIKTQIK